MTAHRPPRIATRLVARCFRPSEQSDVLGDLEEQFHDRVEAAGSRRAAVWYWSEAVRLVAGVGWRQARSAAASWQTALRFDELQYAVRRLRAQPAALLASVLTLAFAISAGVATWTLLSAVLFYPLPVEDPDRLVIVGLERDASVETLRIGYSYDTFVDIRDSGVFERAVGLGSTDDAANS